MRLVKIGHREYETVDKRFNALWSDKRKGGARSCYRVLDRETGSCVRAFNLAEVRESIADMTSPDGNRSVHPSPASGQDDGIASKPGSWSPHGVWRQRDG